MNCGEDAPSYAEVKKNAVSLKCKIYLFPILFSISPL